jgi:hypothetical protein
LCQQAENLAGRVANAEEAVGKCLPLVKILALVTVIRWLCVRRQKLEFEIDIGAQID